MQVPFSEGDLKKTYVSSYAVAYTSVSLQLVSNGSIHFKPLKVTNPFILIADATNVAVRSVNSKSVEFVPDLTNQLKKCIEELLYRLISCATRFLNWIVDVFVHCKRIIAEAVVLVGTNLKIYYLGHSVN